MGEAKKRGTFEERKAESMVLASVRDAERQRQAALREASLTDAQRRQRHNMQMLMATAAGIAAGVHTSSREQLLRTNPMALKHLESET